VVFFSEAQIDLIIGEDCMQVCIRLVNTVTYNLKHENCIFVHFWLIIFLCFMS
jgi:hypothetical protein